MWPVKKISEVTLKPITGEWGDDGGAVNVIRTTNFTNGGALDLRKLVKRNIDAVIVSKKKLVYGDIILEKSGGSPSQPVGRVVYFDQKSDTYLCNNFTCILRPTEEVCSRYLFWFLFCQHSSKGTLKFQNKTTGIINLKVGSYLDETLIPLPPIETQQKIAAILDEADALRQKDKLLLNYYDDLLQSTFFRMFGDPVKNEKGWTSDQLKNVCSKITDGTHHSPEARKEGIPYVTAKHIKFNGIDFFSNPTYIAAQDHIKIFKRCSPEFEDVLYIKDGATTGIAAINSFDFEFSMLSSLALLKCNREKINPYFLVFWLNNWRVRANYLNSMSGAAIKRFTLQKIKNFNILTPPIILQNEFGAIVKQIIKDFEILVQQSEKSDELFLSLSKKAFSQHTAFELLEI